MTEQDFFDLVREGYNRIPLVAELPGDLETPLSVYLKLANAPYSYLLESVVGGERFGRYSIIGLPARTVLRVRRHVLTLETDGQVVETHTTPDPLSFIADYQAQFRAAPLTGLPRFTGGLAGYFGYDAVRYIEPRIANSAPPDTLHLPDIMLLLTEEVAVIDNLSSKLYLIVHADPTQPEAYACAQARLRELKQRLQQPIPVREQTHGAVTPVTREFAHDDYLAAVARAKDYIAAGDMMQVQIGQRLSKRFTEPPLALYRALRSLNPSPYMYFYNLGDFHVVGASPEILVRQEATPEGVKVIIRPLAGTRPRGSSREQDLALEQELLADPKERAEHVMLIDLARNDLGRIAQTGSVKVIEQMVVERYSHVMHIVSHVEGVLKDGLTTMDVFRATFPAGTLTGAPKVRAMEIIDQLEPSKRGIYGGAVGYLSFAGGMDLAIAIRTGIIKDNTLYVQAAAGIVADSVPENEWMETLNKARAVIRAAELVQGQSNEEAANPSSTIAN